MSNEMKQDGSVAEDTGFGRESVQKTTPRSSEPASPEADAGELPLDGQRGIDGQRQGMTEVDQSPVEPAETAAVAPISKLERISSVDVLRGFSLLGILLMNIVSFGLPMSAYMNPAAYGGHTGADLAFWFTNQVLFEGKMRAIFSMLFGAGVLIFTSRFEARGDTRGPDLYYRRTMWLIAFGLVHAYFIWAGDILYSYGVCGLFLFPLRNLKPKTLWITAFVFLLLGAGKNVGGYFHFTEIKPKAEEAIVAEKAGAKLPDELKKAKDEWESIRKVFSPTPEEIDKEIKEMRGSYGTAFGRRAKEVSFFQNDRTMLIDVLVMMLAGMALFKMGVLSAARSAAFYWRMVVIGFAIGVPLNAYLGKVMIDSGFSVMTLFLTWAFYDIGRFSVAAAYIGIINLLCKAGAMKFLTNRLAAVGQMALTNYLFCSIAGTLLFNGYGFGLFGQLRRAELLYVVFAFWAVSLIVSPIWLRYFRFGPAEWLWRSLTYWKKQPMRLESGSGEPRVSAAGA
jgi:uncharacterized protein